MSKSIFIITQDMNLANRLRDNGYKLLQVNYNQDRNIRQYIFLNEERLQFSKTDEDKIIYTNKLSL